ncbi:MAG: PaaI family thioesterase [Pseudomonadota bacterium]
MQYYTKKTGTVLDQIERPAATDFLGFIFEGFEQDRSCAKARFLIKSEHMNAGDIVHGGVLAAMLDEIIGVLIVGATDGASRPITLSMTTSYLTAARNGELHACAELIKIGKSTAFATAELRNEGGDIVAKAEQVSRLYSTTHSK